MPRPALDQSNRAGRRTTALAAGRLRKYERGAGELRRAAAFTTRACSQNEFQLASRRPCCPRANRGRRRGPRPVYAGLAGDSRVLELHGHRALPPLCYGCVLRVKLAALVVSKSGATLPQRVLWPSQALKPAGRCHGSEPLVRNVGQRGQERLARLTVVRAGSSDRRAPLHSCRRACHRRVHCRHGRTCPRARTSHGIRWPSCPRHRAPGASDLRS
jgi:hypothetical protein